MEQQGPVRRDPRIPWIYMGVRPGWFVYTQVFVASMDVTYLFASLIPLFTSIKMRKVI